MKKSYILYIAIIIIVIAIIAIFSYFIFHNSIELNKKQPKSDIKECENLSVSDFKFDLCISGIYRTSNDPNFCENFYDPTYKEACYKIVIENNIVRYSKDPSDYSKCNDIRDNYYKDNCISFFGSASKNLDICNKMTEQKSKDTCYRDVAIGLNSTKICDSIQDIDIKDNCYIFVAPSTGSSTCELIKDQVNKDECYTNYVYLKKDVSVCNNVIDSYQKKNCLSYGK